MSNVPPRSVMLQEELYAAVDLGSNSFHMVVVKVTAGSVQIIGKVKQKVRLAAGLDADMVLDEDSMQRGWNCLATFAERLQDIPASNIRVVGTATLRIAANADVFLRKAEQILNHKIHVISGEEEARQIYLGVAYTSANQGNSLVIDIGGASTEIIVGNDMTPLRLVSLEMGCVTFMERYFPDGQLSVDNFERAHRAAVEHLLPIKDDFLAFDWQNCLGASGTPQAVLEILVAQGISDAIRLNYLNILKQQCIDCGHIDALSIEGLEESRRPIFPSGLVILIALFEQLQIKDMNISGGALREGLIYGMLDNLKDNDRRQLTLTDAMRRFHIDIDHAKRVNEIAQTLCRQMCAQANVCNFDTDAVLAAAALLHETGLHIEYKKYHLHGAYILTHLPLPGYTKLQQEGIRDLVQNHRQEIDVALFDRYHEEVKAQMIGLVRILRIACMLCIRRQDNHVPEVTLSINDTDWTLTFPDGWLKAHPLIDAELANETWLQHKAGWKLHCQ
ncbi:hypothetical protein [Aestuariibacter salexigens]|uniref:Ppx/GppA phosphatase family protein n=1 Tax=Aestuariibacter salexigens TaxID=226010 RepID=UPI000419A72F|nr:hypothetical protein [Aestuariibacter salexigens]